jgi:hypothetical protein
MSAAEAPAATEHTGSFDAETIAAFRAHPDFPRHALALARVFIDQFAGNRFLNLITNDRGRIMVAQTVLYLHYTRDPGDPASGLSSSRLKAFCAQHGICSPGRAAAMLAVMRMSGHVIPAPAAKDRRVRLLIPAPKLLDEFLIRWTGYFDALAQMMPQTADIARAARENDHFAQAFVCELIGQFIAGERLMDHMPPRLAVFTDANGGALMFLSLFVAAGSDGPPQGGRHVQLPISELARRFGVSRAHVKQVLKGAQEKGLLILDDGTGEGIYLTPLFMDHAYQWFAVMFALELHTGRRALEGAAKAAPRDA